MNILYVLTILITYIIFMLIPKTEKKQNVIAWLGISVILIMCYNTLICILLTFIGLLCTLQNLSICNIIITIIFSIVLFKKKKVQKYYVRISDIIFTVLLLILVTVIAYNEYGFPFKIKYEITDASTHYFYADQFYKHSTLLYKIEANQIFGAYDSDFRLPAAYVNEGLVFKVFDGIIKQTDLFILFDLFMLYISGILFYYLLKTYTKENKKLQILAVIFTLMYMLGYQLNSMLYGFIYLSLSQDIIIAFLLMMRSYEKKETSNEVALPILTMLSFGIFFSYAYFIPIIYVGIIVNIIIKGITKKEKILSEDNLYKVMFIIVNPLILGLTYFIILPAATGIKNEISTITAVGAIYQNYITNLIPFIPIFITGVILEIKNKKREYNISVTMLIVAILYAIILLIGNKLKRVSEYYYFKVYSIIWILAIQNTFMIICNILENEKKRLKIATYIYLSIYILAIIVSTLLLKTKIGINDIWYHNLDRIEDPRYILSREELEIFEEYKSLEKKKVYVLSSTYKGRVKWMTVLYDKSKIFSDTIHNEQLNINEWLEQERYNYYVAYYKDLDRLSEKGEPLNENSEKYKIIYRNEYGFILEKIK